MNQQSFEQLKRDLSNRSAEQQYLADRFLAQVEFARGLARREKSQAAGWDKLIDKAIACVAEAGATGLEAALDRAERLLAPIGKVAKTYTVHCVGHAHIDMNWMWSWPETVAVTNDTFTTVLKLMDEFPDFCFTQSQASVYAIMRDYNPELFGQIKNRIAEGRWEVAAAHWVEGDKNLASGESLARHLLYTRRFCREQFGLAPEDVPLDWEPDTFGHAHTIPSIVSRGGVKRYYMCRGGRGEKPPVFWWQGPDGSRILVNLETTWYLNQIGPYPYGAWKPNALALLDFCEKTGLKDWMCVYGVGDHGGGPTRRDILRAHDMDSWPIYPHFVLTTTGKYYSLLEKHGQWPVLDQELNFEFTGCYTSQSLIKKANRFAENQLVEAETAAALTYRLLDRDYPAAELRQAWIDTLFSHFHDILPGSGVRATRDYNQGMFQKITATTGMVKTQFLRALAARVDTTFAGPPPAPATAPALTGTTLGAGVGRGAAMGGISGVGPVGEGPRGFVFFNSTAQDRRDVATVTVWETDPGLQPGDLHQKSFIVRTPDGQTRPAQRLHADFYWGHRFVDLAVPVDVPSLGYSAAVVEEGRVEGGPAGVVCEDQLDWKRLIVHSYAMENEFIAVDFDPVTGGIIKLVNKKTGKDLADPARPLGVLEYLLERPGGMTSWVLHGPKERICPVPVEAFEKGHRGPHVASVVAKLKIKDSTATVTYTLKAGRPELEITVSAVWVERGGPVVGIPTLRMQFPLALTAAKMRGEIPFGSIERDLNHGEEIPAQRWVDVTGKAAGAAAGCALLNDCKYGHSLDDSTLRVTLIRSSYDPDPLPEIGEHTVRLALVPHGRPFPVGDLMRAGAGFNQPLQVIGTDIHSGPLPAQSPALVAAGPENVVVTSVKKAEEDDALIIRLLETAGKAAQATVTLDPGLLGKIKSVTEVDLIERPLAKSAAKVVGKGFSIKVPAHGLASVRVVRA